MITTGKQIKKFISNYDEKNVTQHGVDLRVKEILWESSGVGIIQNEMKTIIPERKPRVLKNNMYELPRGYYEVIFEEGCDIPSNMAMKPIGRSSLVRCGVTFDSGLYDAGFKTKNMGGFITVHSPIIIEKGARLAQIVGWECDDVENLYNGQYQFK